MIVWIIVVGSILFLVMMLLVLLIRNKNQKGKELSEIIKKKLIGC